MKPKTYVKDDESALINYSGRFVYEVLVYINHEDILSLHNHKLFSSDKPIKNVIRFTKISKYLEVECCLYSAPEKWLLENGFIEFVKPEKKKRIKKEKDVEKILSN